MSTLHFVFHRTCQRSGRKEPSMNSRKAAGIIWLLLILLDQFTKFLALTGLKGREPIVLIKNVLELRYVENRGAAFGILQNRQWVFLAVSVLVLAGIFILSRRIPKERKYLPLLICFYFIGAGAAGNMIDRIFRRYVVDFIYFRLIDFPVFNVADIYVTCSCILLILLLFFHYGEEDLEKCFSFGKKRGNADE